MKFPAEILEKIKTYLEEEKKKLLANLDSLKAQDPFTDPDRLSDNAASDTEANEESSHERMEALGKELKYQIQESDDALKRIVDGNYGVCQNCGQMIDTERLSIKPTALLCMECEKKNGYSHNL